MWALKDASFNARHICEIDGKCKKAPRQAPSANMQDHPRAELEPTAREDERGAEHRSLEVRLYDMSRADIYEARIPTRARLKAVGHRCAQRERSTSFESTQPVQLHI